MKLMYNVKFYFNDDSASKDKKSRTMFFELQVDSQSPDLDSPALINNIPYTWHHTLIH